MDVTFFSALLGGLLTFFAPCTLPLVPGYIAFIGGVPGEGEESRSKKNLRRKVLENALLFVLGFSFVFVLFGMASGALGKLLVLHRMLFAQVGGLMIIYLGLTLFDAFPSLPLLRFFANKTERFHRQLSAGSRAGAFLLGLLFAVGWTPCLGPILGTILLLAATGGTPWYGGLLLSVYALGLALPFLLIAYLYGSAVSYVSKLEPYLRLIRFVGGGMLILVGLLLVIGQFGILNEWAGGLLDGRFLNIFLTYT